MMCHKPAGAYDQSLGLILECGTKASRADSQGTCRKSQCVTLTPGFYLPLSFIVRCGLGEGLSDHFKMSSPLILLL